MKKILFMAAALAAFTACSRTDDSSVSSISGDLITLTASFDMSGTKALPDDPTTAEVTFHWEPGDSVFVTDSKECKVFRVIDTSIDKNTASFIGEALSGGMEDYDVYYGIDPSKTEDHQDVQYIPQSFEPRAYGEGTGTSFVLSTFYPVLKLQLKGPAKLGKIEYSAGTHTTTMSFPEGLQLDASDTTAVYLTPMHVATGEFNITFYNFDNLQFIRKSSSTDLQGSYGKILAMPVSTIDYGHYIEEGTDYGPGILYAGVVWAPENCGIGADNAYPYGLLYQWGRKYGLEFQTSNQLYYPLVSSLTIAEGNSAAHAEDYSTAFDDGSNNHNWWSDPVMDSTLWNANGADPNGTPVKTAYDPCPEGWRVPTEVEMQSLYDYIKDDQRAYFIEGGEEFGGRTYSESGLGIFATGDDYWDENREIPPVMFFPMGGKIGIAIRNEGAYVQHENIGYKCLLREDEGVFWTSAAHCWKVLIRPGENDSTIACFTGKTLHMHRGGMDGMYGIEPVVAQSVRCVEDNK